MSITVDSNEISLIIPVKNNQSGVNQFLTRFMETQLPETYPKEIILVDNQSSPPLMIPEERVQYLIPIRLLICSKTGPGAARNEGAKHASGNWLLFIDSDCLPTNSSITGYLNLRINASAYIGAVTALGDDPVSQYYFSQKIHRPPEKKDHQGNVTPKYLVTANFLIRKKVFEDHSGFNEFFTFACEDMDLGVRLVQEAPLAFANEALVLHDYHDGLGGFIRRFFAYGQGNRLVRTVHDLPTFPLPFLPKNKSRYVNFGLACLQWLCLLSGYAVMHLWLLTGSQQRPEHAS